jgi:hypothetical protein
MHSVYTRAWKHELPVGACERACAHVSTCMGLCACAHRAGEEVHTHGSHASLCQHSHPSPPPSEPVVHGLHGLLGLQPSWGSGPPPLAGPTMLPLCARRPLVAGKGSGLGAGARRSPPPESPCLWPVPASLLAPWLPLPAPLPTRTPSPACPGVPTPHSAAGQSVLGVLKFTSAPKPNPPPPPPPPVPRLPRTAPRGLRPSPSRRLCVPLLSPLASGSHLAAVPAALTWPPPPLCFLVPEFSEQPEAARSTREVLPPRPP